MSKTSNSDPNPSDFKIDIDPTVDPEGYSEELRLLVMTQFFAEIAAKKSPAAPTP